jgi:hypothetical protein
METRPSESDGKRRQDDPTIIETHHKIDKLPTRRDVLLKKALKLFRETYRRNPTLGSLILLRMNSGYLIPEELVVGYDDPANFCYRGKQNYKPSSKTLRMLAEAQEILGNDAKAYGAVAKVDHLVEECVRLAKNFGYPLMVNADCEPLTPDVGSETDRVYRAKEQAIDDLLPLLRDLSDSDNDSVK